MNESKFISINEFNFSKYPIFSDSFKITINVDNNSDNSDNNLLSYLKLIYPRPIVNQKGENFYPHFKNYLTEIQKNTDYKCTFVLDYRDELPSDEDMIYICKLLDINSHFIIIGDFDSLPRVLYSSSDLIFNESIDVFNKIYTKINLDDKNIDVYTIIDNREMDSSLWFMNKSYLLKY
jgi:hypothetical protein